MVAVRPRPMRCFVKVDVWGLAAACNATGAWSAHMLEAVMPPGTSSRVLLL